MKRPKYEKEVELLLSSKDVILHSDFEKACQGMPVSSVDSRIRSLILSGRLSRIGHGKYLSINKPSQSVSISPWMKEINSWMIDNCVGIPCCLYEKEANLIVEVAKRYIQQVVSSLKEHWPKVVTRKDAERFPGELEGYILVGKLISDAPVLSEDGCMVPSLEKELIDSICNKDISSFSFQKAMEVFPVNMNKLHRYASRRGVEAELDDLIAGLNKGRMSMFSRMQKYFAKTAIIKAWIFGSFARGEETDSSDIDLLVDYAPDSGISLLTAIRYKLDLEEITGHEVDLIETGCLKPFAVASAEHDKYLIYER